MPNRGSKKYAKRRTGMTHGIAKLDGSRTLNTDYGILPHAERQPDTLYSASYGGGLNSTAMIITLHKRRIPMDCAVFADVGFEYPETYDFVYNHFEPWCKRNGVEFKAVKKIRNGKWEKITDYWDRLTRIPDAVTRECTRLHKIEPIHKYYRERGASKVIEYIGIHAGEAHRIRPSITEWVTKCYPLYEYGIGAEGCREIIRKENLPIPRKSGCPNCFGHPKKELYKLWKENPELWRKSVEIEEAYLKRKRDLGLKPFYYLSFDPKGISLKQLETEFASKPSLDGFIDDAPVDADCASAQGCFT